MFIFVVSLMGIAFASVIAAIIYDEATKVSNKKHRHPDNIRRKRNELPTVTILDDEVLI